MEGFIRMQCSQRFAGQWHVAGFNCATKKIDLKQKLMNYFEGFIQPTPFFVRRGNPVQEVLTCHCPHFYTLFVESKGYEMRSRQITAMKRIVRYKATRDFLTTESAMSAVRNVDDKDGVRLRLMD
jgi:hypothetical protein